MQNEVKVVKVADNPATDVPGHTLCIAKEVAGTMLGISAYSLKYGELGKGGTAIVHAHEEAEHVFYILNGVLTIIVDGKEYSAKDGEALFVPKKVPHAARNDFDGTTTYIALTIPPT